jgi:twitching motility protein PilT
MAQIDKFLHFLIKSGGSDLHVITGSPPILRVDGELQKMKLPPLNAEQVKQLIYEILPDANRKQFEAENDTDMCYEIENVARFRTNVFRDLKGPGLVMRLIPMDIMTVEDLGLPDEVRDLAMLPKGIVLVTGPTGCGKTTTLAALVQYANQMRTDHIITIEDPIEFVHDNKKCIVNHRQVHVHTESFKRALRAGLREDPDIILIGEMRDLETTALALESAETGHLVFATCHTSTASSTVDRIVDQFPPDRQEQIRIMLANSLKAVIAQMLCRRKGKGRVAAFEILVVHSAVANLIREKKTYQLPSVIQTGKKLGMRTMNESLMELIEEDLIEVEEGYAKSTDKQDMNNRLNMFLFDRVKKRQLSVDEAIKLSYWRHGLVELLRRQGYERAVKHIDLNQLKEQEQELLEA